MKKPQELVNFEAQTTDMVKLLSIREKSEVLRIYFDGETRFHSRIDKLKHLLNHDHINYRILGVYDLPSHECDGLQYTTECYQFLMEYMATLSGLNWQKAKNGRPISGEELTNEELSKALQKKTEFTQAEWNAFDVNHLHRDLFIQSGDSYFQPAQDNMVKQMILSKLDGGYMFYQVVNWGGVLEAVIRGKVVLEKDQRYLLYLGHAISLDVENPRPQDEIEQLLDRLLPHQSQEVREDFRQILIRSNKAAAKYVFEKHIRQSDIEDVREECSSLFGT